MRQFLDSAESCGYSADIVEISVFGDECQILTGKPQKLLPTLFRRFRETVFGDVVVGLVGGLLYFMYKGDKTDAAVVGGAAIGLLLTWLVIEVSVFGRGKYEYERI